MAQIIIPYKQIKKSLPATPAGWRWQYRPYSRRLRRPRRPAKSLAAGHWPAWPALGRTLLHEAAVQDLNQLPDELVEQFHATVISANNRQSGRQRKKTKRQQEADFNKLVYNS
jgi:hypothetical protein